MIRHFMYHVCTMSFAIHGFSPQNLFLVTSSCSHACLFFSLVPAPGIWTKFPVMLVVMHCDLPAASLMSGIDIDPGISIDKVKELDQGVRDRVSTELLELTLRELFDFRFMQASFLRTIFRDNSRRRRVMIFLYWHPVLCGCLHILDDISATYMLLLH